MNGKNRLFTILAVASLLLGLARSFPLSFEVDEQHPVCFIESFEHNQVNLKENYRELPDRLP